MTQLHRKQSTVSRKRIQQILRAIVSAWEAERAFHEITILIDPHSHEELAKWTRKSSYLHQHCLLTHEISPSTRQTSTMTTVSHPIRRQNRRRLGSKSSLSRRLRDMSLSRRSTSSQPEAVSAVVENIQPEAHDSGSSKLLITTPFQPGSDVHLQETHASMTAATATASGPAIAEGDEQDFFVFGTGTQFLHQPAFEFYDDMPLLMDGIA